MNLTLRDKIVYSLLALVSLAGGYIVLTEDRPAGIPETQVDRTPRMKLRDRMESAMTATLTYTSLIDDKVSVTFAADSNLTDSMTTAGIWLESKKILAVMQRDYPSMRLELNATLELQNKFGEESEPTVVRCTFMPETISRLQLSNLSNDDIRSIADELWLHDSLK